MLSEHSSLLYECLFWQLDLPSSRFPVKLSRTSRVLCKSLVEKLATLGCRSTSLDAHACASIQQDYLKTYLSWYLSSHTGVARAEHVLKFCRKIWDLWCCRWR